jgi:purine-binding chemotaxis protein CheW
MKKAGIQSHGTSKNYETALSVQVEASPKDKKKILRSRARMLAQEGEKEGVEENYIEVLVFLLAHEMYAIETVFIREVYPLTELTPVPCTPDYIFGIINIRGQILTIIDMKKFFDLPERGITNLNRVILVEGETMELGILADEIIGIQNISENRLNSPVPTMTGIHAGYLRGVTDEGLILLDMERVLNDRQLIVHEEVGTGAHAPGLLKDLHE